MCNKNTSDPFCVFLLVKREQENFVFFSFVDAQLNRTKNQLERTKIKIFSRIEWRSAKNEDIGVSIDTTTSRNQVNVYTNEESE